MGGTRASSADGPACTPPQQNSTNASLADRRACHGCAHVCTSHVATGTPSQVHYLGDPHRGSVWEEAIINCPRHIQLLCMSATVQNPDDLGGWISKVRTRIPCERFPSGLLVCGTPCFHLECQALCVQGLPGCHPPGSKLLLKLSP